MWTVIVPLPRQPATALAGHRIGITPTPWRLSVIDLMEMRTREGRSSPGRVETSVTGAAGTVTERVVWAPGEPLRLTVCPVKTWVVDVPAESVSVSVAV